MKRNAFRLALTISLALNVLIVLPTVALLFGSATIRFVVYQDILAPRLGKPEIVFIGDSITQYGGIWGCRIGRCDFSTWNLGQAGMTTRQILHRQARHVVQLRPKLAFVMAGINDEDKSMVGADVSYGHYRDMLDILRQAGTEPIIQLTLYRQHEPAPEFIDRLNNKLKKYAEQNHLSVIDLNQTLSRDKSLLPEYSIDGLHLTPQAYQVWAAEVRSVLKRKVAS